MLWNVVLLCCLEQAICTTCPQTQDNPHAAVEATKRDWEKRHWQRKMHEGTPQKVSGREGEGVAGESCKAAREIRQSDPDTSLTNITTCWKKKICQSDPDTSLTNVTTCLNVFVEKNKSLKYSAPRDQVQEFNLISRRQKSTQKFAQNLCRLAALLPLVTLVRLKSAQWITWRVGTGAGYHQTMVES